MVVAGDAEYGKVTRFDVICFQRILRNSQEIMAGCEASNAVKEPASFKFTWKIDNFYEVSVTERKLYSDIFSVSGCKWRLLVFPKGNKVDYLSIYLDVPDSKSLPREWSRDADFSFALVNQFNDNSTVKKDAKHVFNAEESDWGFTSFISLSELKDPAQSYIVNSTLTIEAAVLVHHVVQYSTPVITEPCLPEIICKTRSLISELSNGEISDLSQAVGSDLLQQQKEALECFFDMSFKDIQHANAFEKIGEIIHTLTQRADMPLLERTVLENLVSHLEDVRESVPAAAAIAETCQAQVQSVAKKDMELDARLLQKQKELNLLEAEFVRISEDEAKLEAETQFLNSRREELLCKKQKMVIQLQKSNQESEKDLEERHALREEMKEANSNWYKAKEKLALADVQWKLFKDNLSLGKIKFSSSPT